MIVRESSRISGGLRWAVAFIFGLSLITIVITIARLVATLQLWSGTHKGDFLTSDAGLRLEEWLVLSCLAELHVGLLAIFLPSLRMWWRRTHAERKRTQQARECEDGFPALPAMRGGIPGLSITDEIRTVEIRSLNNCGKTEVETRMIRADFRGTNNEKSVE